MVHIVFSVCFLMGKTADGAILYLFQNLQKPAWVSNLLILLYESWSILSLRVKILILRIHVTIWLRFLWCKRNYLSLQSSARGCRLVWSRLVDLGSIDPGSNPGSPTTVSVDPKWFNELHVSAVCWQRCSLWNAGAWWFNPYFDSAFHPYSGFSLHQINLWLDKSTTFAVELFFDGVF